MWEATMHNLREKIKFSFSITEHFDTLYKSFSFLLHLHLNLQAFSYIVCWFVFMNALQATCFNSKSMVDASMTCPWLSLIVLTEIACLRHNSWRCLLQWRIDYNGMSTMTHNEVYFYLLWWHVSCDIQCFLLLSVTMEFLLSRLIMHANVYHNAMSFVAHFIY